MSRGSSSIVIKFILVVIIIGAVLVIKFSRNTDNYQKAVEFMKKPQIIALPSTASYADKRGFDDFNNDNISDMIEVEDDNWGPGQDFKVRVFYGNYQNEILQFGEKFHPINLPIKMKWFSSATKIDVGDLNGDGYSDIIFSQYVNGLFDDYMHIAFAINDGNGGFFALNHTTGLGSAFERYINDSIGTFGLNSDDSLYDYLKMDWADVDGNGTDDLLLCWDEQYGSDLIIEVLYTDISNGIVVISDKQTFIVPDFMWDRSINHLDVEDYNGDGKADILLRYIHLGSDTVTIAVALQGQNYFIPCKDWDIEDTDMRIINFEKYDSFDVNNDGKADFVHVGNKGGKKIMSYNLMVNKRKIK